MVAILQMSQNPNGQNASLFSCYTNPGGGQHYCEDTRPYCEVDSKKKIRRSRAGRGTARAAIRAAYEAALFGPLRPTQGM